MDVNRAVGMVISTNPRAMRPFAGFALGRAAAIFASLLMPVTLASQNSPQSPQIRVATHLVQIGVIVRDSNGPVANLTKDDFVVLDRGKPQKISVFSVESGESAPQPAQPLPPNAFSNLPQYGTNRPRSVTIVLLDNLNTLSGSSPQTYENTPFWLEDHALANAKQHLIEFLKELDPKDRVAIYGLSNSLHVLCDFTCDRDQLLAVVSKYDTTSHTQRGAVEPGDYHFPDQPDSDPRALNEHVNADVQELAALNNQARAQTTMGALVAIAAHAANIPGRKNLLWLTANLPFSGQAIAMILGRADIAAYPIDARGLLPRAPLTSPAEVYDADDYVTGKLRTPPAQSSQPTGIETMEKMADDTGGRAFVNTNDLSSAIRKVVEDSAVTYTLGFYVEPSSLDGKFHELKVQVGRSGLSVRYPKGYFALKDAPATENKSRNAFLAGIRSPLDSSAIGMQVKVDRVEQPLPHSLQVLGSVDIKNVQLAQHGNTRTGSLDVYVIEQDLAGNVVDQVNNRLRLELTEQQYQSYLQSGIGFREYVQPKPEAVVLRVLVQDPVSSELGSVIIPVARVH
jgi:VWFA-related protein